MEVGWENGPAPGPGYVGDCIVKGMEELRGTIKTSDNSINQSYGVPRVVQEQ